MQEDETLGGWEALAEGLAELCKGLVESGAQEVSDALEEVFENGGLAELLSSCPSSRSRVAILSIAAAAPDLVASGEVRGRCLVSLAAAGRDVEGREAVALLTTAIAGVFCREKLISMLVRAFEHPDQAGRGQEAFRDAAVSPSLHWTPSVTSSHFNENFLLSFAALLFKCSCPFPRGGLSFLCIFLSLSLTLSFIPFAPPLVYPFLCKSSTAAILRPQLPM